VRSAAVRDVTVEIAGVRTAFVTAPAEVAAVVSQRYAGFLSLAPAHWRFETGLRPGGLVPLEDVVVGSGGGPNRLVVERHDFLATLDLAARAGTLALGVVDPVTIDTFLRVAYSLALLEAGGLLVHAASLGRGPRAWLFPGRSGSGKTTLARLSPDATLLSDEISIVRLEAGGARVHGSPFWGELARAGANAAVPLVAIHFLRHADRHAAIPLMPRQALAALLPNVLFFAAEPALVARVFDVAAGLVERVPCFTLGFRPEASVWEAIEHAA
jgi:hypothetical protein